MERQRRIRIRGSEVPNVGGVGRRLNTLKRTRKNNLKSQIQLGLSYLDSVSPKVNICKTRVKKTSIGKESWRGKGDSMGRIRVYPSNTEGTQ